MKKIYILILVLFFGIWSAGILIAGAKFGLFLNIPSLIVTLGIAIILLLSNFSLREIFRYFAIGFKKDEISREELKNGILFFKSLQRYLIISGFTGFLVGAIVLLWGFEDPSSLASGLAVALITILYALMLTACLALPFRTGLQRKLNERA